MGSARMALISLKKNNWVLNLSKVFLCFVFPFILVGCYSFHGGSPPAGVKTIAVPTVTDASGFGNATIAQQCTSQLIQKIIRDNSLQVTDRTGADASLNATITSITNKTVAVGADQRSSMQEVDVTVKVSLENLRKHTTLWEQSFTNNAQYDPTGDASQRDNAILQAIDHITDDIVLQTVSEW